MRLFGVAQVCLTDDDLAGLNWLYPSCEGAKNVRTCFHSARNIGYLRLFCWVVVPMLIGLAILLLMIACVKRHQRAQLGWYTLKLQEIEEHNHKLLDDLARHHSMDRRGKKKIADLEAHQLLLEEEMEAMATELDNEMPRTASWFAKNPASSPSRRASLGAKFARRASAVLGGLTPRSRAPDPPAAPAAGLDVSVKDNKALNRLKESATKFRASFFHHHNAPPPPPPPGMGPPPDDELSGSVGRSQTREKGGARMPSLVSGAGGQAPAGMPPLGLPPSGLPPAAGAPPPPPPILEMSSRTEDHHSCYIVMIHNSYTTFLFRNCSYDRDIPWEKRLRYIGNHPIKPTFCSFLTLINYLIRH